MTDREKIINHFKDAIEASGDGNKWRFVREDILEDAVNLLKEIPTIVKCKDCKYWDQNSGLTARKCCKHGTITKQFDYCSYGEAK